MEAQACCNMFPQYWIEDASYMNAGVLAGPLGHAVKFPSSSYVQVQVLGTSDFIFRTAQLGILVTFVRYFFLIFQTCSLESIQVYRCIGK
jgi:hypothetical protein